MVAVARLSREAPRLVLDALAGPRIRLKVWQSHGPFEASNRGAAHHDVELAWIDEGAVAYGIGRTSFETARGAAMLVPTEVEHATSFLSAVRGSAVHMDASLVAEIADAMGRTRGPAIGPVPNAARIAALGAMLEDELRRSDRGALLAADALVEAMVVTALRGDGAANDEGASPNDPAIVRAIRFVEEQYAEPIGVDEMARAAHMSRFHFSRRFRAATKQSPYQFIQSVRLARAAELLRRGRAGVTEVALSVGFSDPSRFARAFRQRFGASPQKFVTSVR